VLELVEISPGDVPARQEELTRRLAQRRSASSFQDLESSTEQARAYVEASAEGARHFDVVDAGGPGEPVGLVWWSARGGEANVADIELDDPERVAELLPAFCSLAREGGFASFGAAGTPGERARQALVEIDGFVPRATNMALALDGELGDSGNLELREMTQEQFDAYLAASTESYIVELAAAGMTPEAARKRGTEQMQELVPDGLDSPGQSFFTAYDGESPVGHLWLSTERPMAFVYDIEVDESQRRKGYGEAMMNAGARWSRDRGHRSLGLNVFAHNPHARALYDKLGYDVTMDFRTIDVPDAG
jgi:GNAT superfamily N-acetyltransferase